MIMTSKACRWAFLDTYLDLQSLIKTERLSVVHEILIRAYGQMQDMTLPFCGERYARPAAP